MWAGAALLIKATYGAVAPTVALSLFALIGVGGIAFDYARLASMDTELQQAADQAALAAATQLDRADGAQARAAKAIQNPAATRLAANLTRFANDNAASGASVEITNITFCKEFDDSVADTTAACTVATGDNDSVFVIVRTQLRTANYALTPVVAALSGTVSASAVAGVESSICNVAPLLVCAPSDDFPTNADIGKGMIMKVAGGNSWAPGNYGFLDFGNGNPAVLNALLGNGLNGCQATDDNQTEPGNKNATDAINTRMDVYAGQNKNDAANCDTSTGFACPAQDTRKDMVMTMTYAIEQPAADPAPLPTSVPNCGANPTGNGNPNPSITYTTDFAQNGAAKQFGRDTCHYLGNCPTTGGAQNFGNKTWDRDAYIAANHPGATADSIAAAIGGEATGSTLTRYQIYQWEIAHMGSGTLDPVQAGPMATTVDTKGNGKNAKTTYTFKKQCAFNQPKFATAATTTKDRRVLPVVAANCENLHGSGTAFEDYTILRVFDVFITEPSLQRSAAETGVAGATQGTDDKEIYGEIIGPAETFAGTTGFQYYSKNKPYLVR
jgi:Flp pilus assembly protein TadG